MSPEDLFAYVYAVLAGGYTERFSGELEIPGPRIPITKNSTLFAQAAALGKRLVWLHTYGERFTPEGEKPGVVPGGTAKCTTAVPADSADYPEEFDFDPESKRLTVGKGVFEPVDTAIWEFSVSGLQVVRSWLSYRMKEGAGKRSSPLDAIRPERWPADFTEELCKLLWIIEQTINLTPQAEDLLEQVVDGPVFTADELPTPSDAERAAPQVKKGEPEQLEMNPT